MNSLFDRIVINDENYSHVIFEKTKKNEIIETKFKIPMGNRSVIWNEIASISQSGETKFSIAEAPKEFLPFIVYSKFSFSYQKKDNIDYYLSFQFLKKYCEIFMGEIKNYGVMTEEENYNRELVAFLFLGDTSIIDNKGSTITFKIKIIFPFVKCSSEVFDIISNKSSDEMRRCGLRNYLENGEFYGDFSKTISKKNYERLHFLYGFPDLKDTRYTCVKIFVDTINPNNENFILNAEDVQTMRNHHVNAFLVGEAFMRQPDPGIALEQLFFN